METQHMTDDERERARFETVAEAREELLVLDPPELAGYEVDEDMPGDGADVFFEHGSWWVRYFLTDEDVPEMTFSVVDTSKGLDLEQVG